MNSVTLEEILQGDLQDPDASMARVIIEEELSGPVLMPCCTSLMPAPVKRHHAESGTPEVPETLRGVGC